VQKLSEGSVRRSLSNPGYTDENLAAIAHVYRSCDSDLRSPVFSLRSWQLAEKANLDNSHFGRTMGCMKKVRTGNRISALGASSDAVDAYIAAVPEPTRTTLVRLREIIRSAVPKEAVEVISYGIPAFALSKPFFGIAAFKNLPFSGSLFNSFTDELTPYTRTKSSLHLPFDKPLPATLIRKLVRARVAAIPSPARRSSQLPG
jgi:uncharacterized protein YdhG (YjbR/CyaY superfamily)